MPSPLLRLMQHLNKAASATVAPRDSELLRRFVQERDPAAFEALVRRHGPMVLGVCLRILKNEPDARDAFQACFIVLLRKASSIRAPEALAGWLFGVARRTALDARKAAARRRAREAALMPQDEPPDPLPPAMIAELREVLDQELAKLPEKYRLAVVLCDLQERSRKEAAAHLGVAEGTVASRLARGRFLLAARLRNQGIAVSACTLALAIGECSMAACVPPTLVQSTLSSAALVIAGKTAAIPASVATLAELVLKSLWVTRAKALLAWVAAGLLLLGGGAGLTRHLWSPASLTVNAAPASAAPQDTVRQEKLAFRDPQAPPPDTWEIDFEDGLPKGFCHGECVRVQLPGGSQGAVRAVPVDCGKDGTFFQIHTGKSPQGLFAVHADSHFHFTFKMENPNWINVFLIGFNADGSHSSNYLFNDLQYRPGVWRTVSIPLSHFKRLKADGRQPWRDDVPGLVLFSSPGADRGLVIDRMWVTRGGPGFVRYEHIE